MPLPPGARRSIFALWFAALAVIWTIAWLAPAIGLYHDDAVYLVSARSLATGHGYTIASLPQPLPQTKYPPLFPAVLALFSLASTHPQWLKLLPLLCGLGWLALTSRLLRKLGASPATALLIAGITASSPMVIFLATNLMSETLFALLLTASVLFLSDDRPIPAGLMAGLATLTRSAGVPLIAAGVLFFLLRRQPRHALRFAVVAIAIAAPWFLWVATHPVADPYYGSANYGSLNIFTSLSGPEKTRVITQNLLYLLATPFSLLSGWTSMFAVLGAFLVYSWSLFARRQLLPDLVLALYALMLIGWMGVPDRYLTPVLPLLLWLPARTLTRPVLRAAVATAAVLLALWAGASRLPNAIASGYYTNTGRETDNWSELQTMFAYIRENTPADAVIVTNLDPVFHLNTGRKAARAFSPNYIHLFYRMGEPTITPGHIEATIARTGATHLVLTPDRDFSESPAFHESVQILHQRGRLTPIPIPNLSPPYRLLKIN